MYALIANGQVSKYPYSTGMLCADNPQTSFPESMTGDRLAEWNVFPVFETERPSVDHTKIVTEDTPSFTDGRWTQTWVVSDATEEQVQQLTQQQADLVRSERNALLTSSDWTQLSDSPLNSLQKADWLEYRSELRNIPEQPGFPWEVVWPVSPGQSNNM